MCTWTRSNLEDNELKKIRLNWKATCWQPRVTFSLWHFDTVSFEFFLIDRKQLMSWITSKLRPGHEQRDLHLQSIDVESSSAADGPPRPASKSDGHVNLLDMWWNRICRVDVEQKRSIHSNYMYLLQVAGVLQKSCPSKCPDASMMSEMDRNGVLSGSRFLRFQRGKAVEDCAISDTYLTFRIASASCEVS